MRRLLVHEPVQGTVITPNGTSLKGDFRPTVFFSEDHTVLGVVDPNNHEHQFHIVIRCLPEVQATILGRRWAAFIAALAEGTRITQEIAREAWFASNRAPSAEMRGTVERGCDVMRSHLPQAVVDEIRAIAA